MLGCLCRPLSQNIYVRTDGRKDNQEPPAFTLEIGTEILEFNNDVKKVKYTYVRTYTTCHPKFGIPRLGLQRLGAGQLLRRSKGKDLHGYVHTPRNVLALL